MVTLMQTDQLACNSPRNQFPGAVPASAFSSARTAASCSPAAGGSRRVAAVPAPVRAVARAARCTQGEPLPATRADFVRRSSASCLRNPRSPGAADIVFSHASVAFPASPAARYAAPKSSNAAVVRASLPGRSEIAFSSHTTACAGCPARFPVAPSSSGAEGSPRRVGQRPWKAVIASGRRPAFFKSSP
jgi:hypothetical protein